MMNMRPNLPSTMMEQPAALLILRGFAVFAPCHGTVHAFQESGT